MKAVSEVLFCLLRLVVVIALIILSFGIPYSKLLLDLYGGSLLSTGNCCFYLSWKQLTRNDIESLMFKNKTLGNRIDCILFRCWANIIEVLLLVCIVYCNKWHN